MSKEKARLFYLLLDWLAAALSWTLFYMFRRAYIEPLKYGYEVDIFYFDNNYILGIIAIPICWVLLFALLGYYKDIFRKSRLREIVQTVSLSFFGSIVLFFTLLLNDEVYSYKAYPVSFLVLFLLQAFFFSSFRLFFLTYIKSLLKRRIIGYPTILVGSNKKALDLYNELERARYSQGYQFIGYVSIQGNRDSVMRPFLPYLGDYKQLPEIIHNKGVEEVILAIESSEHDRLNELISYVEDGQARVKIIPDMYDIISGMVRINYIFGTALIEVMPEMMPVWQQNVKRLMDIVVAMLVLILFSPMYLAVALAVKFTSKGPVIYRQERIGIHGKPFMIYKFRSMYTDAEKAGPQLAKADDPRVTPIGRILRKYRIDEFPQFWNVLRGDMTLVGPRPERHFFIEKISAVAPHYRHLLRVRPGITSWGQIKFGYAENLEQMLERMKFDILYIENMSLGMDFKILFYTVLIMLQGRGK